MKCHYYLHSKIIVKVKWMENYWKGTIILLRLDLDRTKSTRKIGIGFLNGDDHIFTDLGI